MLNFRIRRFGDAGRLRGDFNPAFIPLGERKLKCDDKQYYDLFILKRQHRGLSFRRDDGPEQRLFLQLWLQHNNLFLFLHPIRDGGFGQWWQHVLDGDSDVLFTKLEIKSPSLSVSVDKSQASLVNKGLYGTKKVRF